MGENGAGVVAGSLTVADVAVTRDGIPVAHHGRLAGLVVGIGRAGAVVICLLAQPAAAYRPFDGTDAAVADEGEVEIEFQPAGAFSAGPTKPLSEAVFNYGFACCCPAFSRESRDRVLPQNSARCCRRLAAQV
jgi:hypothetical protein